MSDRAAIVVVGAGIVGASVAYHLGQMGHTDILVVDQGDIPHNPGSTSHAPGGVVAMSHNRLLAKLSFYSTDLYRRLVPYDGPRHTYNPVGSIEVARTAERMADLVREHGEAQAFGAETHLLDPGEVVDKVPYLDQGPMTGGLFIPDSAIVSGVNVTGALIRDGQASGAVRLRRHTRIVDVETKNGRVAGLLTEGGERIETDRVVLCTNIWPLPTAHGFPRLPLLAFEHQYVETTDVLEGFDPSDPDDEVTVPTVRDLDAGLYYRHHWNRIGVGSYHHLPLAVAPQEVGDRAEHPFTAEHFEEAWKKAREILPALHRTDRFSRSLNGMFAFTVDGMPLIGETATTGLWTAIGVWITHAGGVGKAVAELITEGEAEWDLREASLHRFHDHQFTEEYIRVVTERNYREVYDIKHPQEPPTAPREVRLSPFAPRLASLDPHNVPFGGIELAAWYGANEVLIGRYTDELPERSDWASRHWSQVAGAEHLVCREKAALLDLTGLSILEVTGEGASGFVDYLCSNSMDVSVGRVVYTLWLTEKGGIRRDLAVARLAQDRYWMFVGEGTRPQDRAWAHRQAARLPDVTVTDISDAYTALGLWGPEAPALLDRIANRPLDLGYFRGGWVEIGPIPVYCMRISYVGEAGYELHIPIDQALPVFDRIWEEGRSEGLVMAGSTALNSLRIEKGYRLWGADLHTEHDPYQARMGWTVALDKGDFLGAEACRERSNTEPETLLSPLVLDEGDPLGNEAVLHDGAPVGYVTSAAYGHSIGAPVAYTYLPARLAHPGTGVEVLVEGEPRPATVGEEPLWDPKGDRLRKVSDPNSSFS